MYAQTVRKQVWLSTALRALLLAALAVALWMLIPARAAWACGGTVLCVDADATGSADGSTWAGPRATATACSIGAPPPTG